MFKNKTQSEREIALRKAKQVHKTEVKKLRQQIKKHHMLLKQAKLQYKITKY